MLFNSMNATILFDSDIFELNRWLFELTTCFILKGNMTHGELMKKAGAGALRS